MKTPRIVRRKKRVGRGLAGGGAKSGRGMKGQLSRAGSVRRFGFEGGQTPLYQRLPKGRGTKQRFASQAVHPVTLTIRQLHDYQAGTIIGPGQLRRAGYIKRHQRVKLIGDGKLEHKLTVRVHAATARARQAVEQAGGKVELINAEA